MIDPDEKAKAICGAIYVAMFGVAIVGSYLGFVFIQLRESIRANIEKQDF
jgi:hypothetical protein